MFRVPDVRSIGEYLEALSGLRVREGVDTRIMWNDYRAGKYTDVLGRVKSALDLSCRLRLGKVASGGPINTPAWVNLPETMPLFGTRLFEESEFTVYVRKDFLYRSELHQLSCAFAHECSHIILESVIHPLRKEERAVDLTAMMLGFSETYLQNVGKKPSLLEHWRRKIFQRMGRMEATSLGYLTPTEVRHAHSIIMKMRKRKKL